MEFDVIVVGGGLSGGLPAAAYLQKAGASVLVIERRHELGAYCPTYEPWPGVHMSPHVAANMSGTSPLMEDLELEKYGYRLAFGPTFHGTTFADGKNVLIYHDAARTAEAFRKHSERDAKVIERIQSRVKGDAVDIAEKLLYTAPEVHADEVMDFAYRLGRYVDIDADAFSQMNALQFAEEVFESDHVRMTAVMAPAWNILGHGLAKGHGAFAVMSQFVRGGRGMAVGGNHSLVHALNRCFVEHGGRSLRNCPVERILVRDGEAVGVQLAQDAIHPGMVINARKAVISNVGPRMTLELIGEDAIKAADSKLYGKMKYWKTDYRASAVSCWVLKDRPRWKSEPWDENINKSFMFYRGWDSWEECKQWFYSLQNSDLRGTCAKTGEILDFSTLDPTARSPEGYVGVRSEEIVPYSIRSEGGPERWDELKEELAEKNTDMMESLAPGFRNLVLQTIYHTPLDLWRYNPAQPCGAVLGGDFTEDQWLLDRMPYRAPIRKLYMSSGVWPHAISLMATGYNCACIVAEDLGIRKQPWWVSRPIEWLQKNLPRLMAK